MCKAWRDFHFHIESHVNRGKTGKRQETWFNAVRKHRMFLPCSRNIYWFLETKIDAGNIGGTSARYACSWKNVSSFFWTLMIYLGNITSYL